MRHRKKRGKLGRKTGHRLMMLRNMATSLFDKERIMTTMPKAKQLRPFAEKLITLARKGDLHSRRLTLKYIHDKKVVRKLFDDIGKRFDNGGQGGYTRIVAYSSRWGDGAPRAFIELKNAILPGAEEGKPAAKKQKETKSSGKETKPAEEAPKKSAAGKKKPAEKSEPEQKSE